MPTPELTVDVEIERQSGNFSIAARFEAGQGITLLFGPSGAGKSTTLAAIAGLIKPTRGTIALGDEVWFDSKRGIDLPIERRGLSFVFQSLALFPHMTAEANVAYGLPRDLSSDARRERARAMLKRMKVEHVADRKPPTLSGGEAQRVALARAFARTPRLALLDEPFSAMDRELRRELAADVRAYVDEAHIPLIHVTHHRNEARALGDRVVLFDHGRITSIGTVDELLPHLAPEEEFDFASARARAH
jgi:molybdate transport system ATP-binding protein